MKDRIILIATLRLIDNQLENLTETVKALQAHCAQTEKGLLQYDWYVSETDNTLKVLETYANSEAVLEHFDNYKKFKDQLDVSREFIGVELYGNASDALRERIKKVNAKHFKEVSFLNRLGELKEECPPNCC